MKSTIYIITISAFLFTACNMGPKTKLEEKRAELDSLNNELADLHMLIKKVEHEITELDTTARANAIPVRAYEVALKPFKNPYQLQGLVQSDKNVLISPEVPAKVVKIHVKEGQKVSAGQLIATLDGSIAGSQINELETALELARVNYEKQERLWKQKIGSEMQYLQAKNQYEGLKDRLATAREQLGKYTLRSPISGTIDEIRVNEGELVGGMTSGPVARVVDLSDIKIKANVSERYVGKINAGDEVMVYYPSLNITEKEKVTAVSNVIDVNNRTFVVYVQPKNNQSSLKPNLLALITAYDYQVEDAIAIPTKVIRNDGNKDFVFVIETQGEKNIVAKRTIEIAQQFPSQTLISGGLNVGDQIITDGANSVIAGDEVKIITSDK